MVMGSAFDILSSAWAPRVSFVNYPLGHQAGKPFDREDQLHLVKQALSGLEVHSLPGQVNMLQCDWSTTVDHCAEVGSSREAIPHKRDSIRRYQTAEDLQAAVARFGKQAEGVVSREAQRQAAIFRAYCTQAAAYK